MANTTIWVYIDKKMDGSIKNVSLELLNGAKTLVQDDEKVTAVIIGHTNEATIDTVKRYGADQIISVDDEAYQTFTNEAFTHALATLVDEYAPSIVLFGATLSGKNIAAALAAKCQTSAINDVSAVTRVDGKLEWTRAIYGGKLLTKVVTSGTLPQIATIRTGVFTKQEQPSDAAVITKSISLPDGIVHTKVVNVIQSESTSINLEEAKIVVGAGRGVTAEHLTQLTELASLFEAGGVGGTRPVIDEGLLAPQQQIGLSGKKVSPDIYFAIGISGASQHVQGIKDSHTIVAVNRDADAPIFEVADYGIVGDLNKVVPALITEINELKK